MSLLNEQRGRERSKSTIVNFEDVEAQSSTNDDSGTHSDHIEELNELMPQQFTPAAKTKTIVHAITRITHHQPTDPSTVNQLNQMRHKLFPALNASNRVAILATGAILAFILYPITIGVYFISRLAFSKQLNIMWVAGIIGVVVNLVEFAVEVATYKTRRASAKRWFKLFLAVTILMFTLAVFMLIGAPLLEYAVKKIDSAL
ncbi:hypothetical protein J8273_4303 [Carpediemonas membranifera]|uniref:Uncharacterized protein n=1 Tax=Carpediemonas membranifera TaxID=201153 RepID=A0A8J6ATI1_9EUKA|nr:hypothetical protein J8273_4303 [Carpediemonas membranifera]|eukprot:KAG9394201.1 hypothetical protein J8273_4303 [Carpediemonas membranifera]